MIKTENIYINDDEFIRTYSDEGRYVVRDGVSYEEAVDPSRFGRVYTEGDVIPEDDNEDADTKATEILNILTGGAL